MEKSSLFSIMLQFVSNEVKELRVIDEKKLSEGKIYKNWQVLSKECVL